MSPRFLWFFLGAGLGAWWATNKKMNIDCHVHRMLPPAPTGPGEQMAPNSSQLPAQPMGYNRDWEQERARVREFSQTAGDTVAELSEATLNTILQATEALKAKMAEHRAIREEERRIEEERRRNPPRYV
ncbi:hypothetical protein DFH07DRAFT_808812 [Mycena maculata]|uniref:Uncharacterized protein n=1 Tax=Mycena maculata TaxID=230809 RepID=A0AAD7NM56_9AGAR|nr:hypothetical protein DFH07DRAFT_808812 [Mycena maculata]